MSSAIPTAHARERFFINRNFALLWCGQAISISGDYLFVTTVVLWIAQRLAVGRTWAPLAVSGELIALSVPTVLVGPIAGVFVDRWKKRQTMLLMDGIRGALLFILAAVALVPARYLSLSWVLGIIYLTIILASTCTQFFNPSRLGLIGDIVAPEQQARASGLVFMTLSLGVIIGPAIATPLFFAFGPVWALIFDGLSFLASFLAIQAIHPPPASHDVKTTARGSLAGEFLVGLRFFAGNRVLRTLLIVTALTLFSSSAINALGIFFLRANLRSAPQWYGLLSVATGVGVLVGSFVATWLVPRLGIARSFWLGTLITGILIIAYARQTTLAGAVVLLAVIGLPSAGLNVAISPLILQSAPRELIGRAAAIFTPATNLAALLSAAIAGFLASTVLQHLDTTLLSVHFGPYDTIYLLGGIIITLSSLFAWSQLRHFHEAQSSPQK